MKSPSHRFRFRWPLGIVLALLGFSAPSFAETPHYVVGTWNLEYFKDGAKRGFPESTRKGPSYPPRTDEDYHYIAGIIQRLQIKILLLQEINGKTIREVDRVETRSTELERLIEVLGKEDYDYVVSQSGQSQRTAILYDRRAARMNASEEMRAGEGIKVQGKQLFARQPLCAFFTFLVSGESKNDLVVIDLHLASGESLTVNHDQAIQIVVQAIHQTSSCIPPGENDVLIAGDFNANRFDRSVEPFWNRMERTGWDVLGDREDRYSPTRLSGVPLALRSSRLDYIIVTKGNHGLSGEEITADAPVVHTEGLGDSPETFRRRASDHLPVTIDVAVTADND